MRLHRFFARNLSGNKNQDGYGSGTSERIKITTGSTVTYAHDTHQWQRVFRYGQGDRVILFDGSGKDYVCEILEYQGEIALLRIVEVRENFVHPAKQVILVVSIVKRDTFEWIVEKATELGIEEIIPVLSERSEKKGLNMERLEKIMIEASEQSGRGDVPVLRETTNLQDFLKDILKDKNKMSGISEASSAIVFDPSGKKFSDVDFSASSVVVFIGPEGGWSPAELEIFKQSDIPVVSLGQQILRAETAVVASLSRIVF